MSKDLPIVPETGSGSTSLAPLQGVPLSPADAAAPAGNKPMAQLRRMAAALLRYKWMILLVTVLGTAAGAAATQLIKPRYPAQATLWIEGSDSRRGPIQSGELLRPEGYLELLKSFAVLDHVVREQGLYLQPADPEDVPLLRGFTLAERFRPGSYQLRIDKARQGYVLTTGEGVEVERGALGAPIGAELGFAWRPEARRFPAGKTIRFEVKQPRDVAVELAGQVNARLSRDGRFMRINYSGTDPERVTGVVNALAERLVVVATELKRVQSEELSKVLHEQLTAAERALVGSESALEGFRVQTITLPTDGATPIAPGVEATSNPAMGSYFALKFQADQLRADRQAIARALAQRSDSVPLVNTLGMIASVQATPEFQSALQEITNKRALLRQERQVFTDNVAKVQQLAADLEALETQTLPQVAVRVDAALAARIAELQSRIGSAGSELQQIPARAIEEQRRKRNVVMAEGQYSNLRQRYEDARLASLSTIPDISIMDRAVVPQVPSDDKRRSLMLLALVGSLGVGVLGAILRDRVDPRFLHPQQVSEGTGLNVLGAVPHLRIERGQPDPEATQVVAEAFREVRLSLAYAQPAEHGTLLTISSPGSGEGKSFISLNLALAFADLGRPTLLIDGDVRRGALHRLLGLERTPGLTDYLAGNATREQVIQRTQFPLLHVIGSGSRSQLGPELLGSPKMERMIQELRAQYPVILIDSAPLGAGADAYILSTLTQNMVLVVRNGRTNREFTEAKLGLIDRLPIRLLGVILNDVPPSKLYSYYSYLPGYHAHDEAEAEVLRSEAVGASS